MSSDPRADLIFAILTLDSYDRGYGSGLNLSDTIGTKIGDYTVSDTKGDAEAFA